MQAPPSPAIAASAAARSPRCGNRHVVRLSGALAQLCGQIGGQDVEELVYYEDELLGQLRAATQALSTQTGLGAAAAAAASVLAALLRPGASGGGQDAVSEDAVLVGRLREAGLITYPSPLLEGLLEELPEVLAAEVLGRLAPVDRTMLAAVGRPWHAAVLASGLPRVGGVVRLQLEEFCTSVDRLTFVKARGCVWDWLMSQ